MDWSNDYCPISNEEVKEALPRSADFAEFICPTCGRFRITGTAMKIVRTKELQDRLAVLDEAKRRAPNGIIPLIDSGLL